MLAERKREIDFFSFKSNGHYSSGRTMSGTNNVQYLKDITFNKGICDTSPGWIIFELNTIYSMRIQ
jgi:hypothetical protein